MIISRTPFRVSLFGGGTDYPAWYRRHGGSVVGMAIDKYCYMSVRPLPPFFEHKHRIVWSQIELPNDIDEIRHPAVKAILGEFAIEQGLEITYSADLPARSGLGTSSSFTVGLINALNALKGKMVSKSDLANEAIRIEQDVIQEAVGSQDQVWAAYGGFNRINFHTNNTHDVSPIILNAERHKEIQSSFMLFFSGFSRYATEIAEKQIANFDNRKQQLRGIGAICDEAMGVLQSSSDPVRQLGELLHEGWMLKRELADGVATTDIDEMYAAGLEAGAIGGKLLGAGGGGFMLFMVDPDKQQQVRERLKDLIHVSFNFDSGGSKIVVFEPDDHINGQY